MLPGNGYFPGCSDWAERFRPVARESTSFPNLLTFVPRRVCPSLLSVFFIFVVYSSRSIDVVSCHISSLGLKNDRGHTKYKSGIAAD